MIDGTYSSIVGWTNANAAGPGSVLYEGYGVENTITVRYSGTRFTVDFNTTSAVCTFTAPFPAAARALSRVSRAKRISRLNRWTCASRDWRRFRSAAPGEEDRK